MVPGQIRNALDASGDTTEVQSVDPFMQAETVTSYRITTNQSSYFIKWNHDGPDGLIHAEQNGLLLLRNHAGVPTPDIFPQTAESEVLVMSWVKGKSDHTTPERLGQALAKLHAATDPLYGLNFNNFIGVIPQENKQHASWTNFFRNQRLEFQSNLMDKSGWSTPARLRMLDKIMGKLDQWIDEKTIKPSLLHGDFWSGNWVVGPGGEPYWIDPSPAFGDSEYDLAFSELFGGFPPKMYGAYREIRPLRPGYEDRRYIYQLYFLLVHLNIFGESYGPQIDRILRRFGE